MCEFELFTLKLLQLEITRGQKINSKFMYLVHCVMLTNDTTQPYTPICPLVTQD